MSRPAFRDDVDRMSVAELKRYIGDLEMRLDTLQESSKDAGLPNLCRAFGFTHKEALLVATLSDGVVHTKDGLLSALYWSQPGEPPEIKIIDVFVCKTRKKLVGSGADIGTQWGIGYYLAGGDVIRRAMSGEPIDRADGCGAPHGRVPGDKPRRRHGEIRDRALAYLRSLPANKGVIAVPLDGLYAAVQAGQSTSGLLHTLRKSGHLDILNLRERSKGSPYLVRLK